MPRVNASNGIRPEIRALAILQLGKTVTPAEINAHVGTGDYAAKYVSFLNTRYGFNITANKDGRKVVSYTVIDEPDNAAELRSMQPKAPKVKAAKAPKVAKVTKVANPTATAIANMPKKSVEDAKAANLAKLKEVGQKFAAAKKAKTKKAKKVREFDDVTEQFGTSGEVATSYSIDKDWDSINGVDLSKLI